MSTKQSTIEYIEDQLVSLDAVSTKKMFGEYALYVGDKVVALVCDDTLYVKITPQGKDFVVSNVTHTIHGRGVQTRIPMDL
jgi:TfoX/Sxy family transcriptional regulator of competence genes